MPNKNLNDPEYLTAQIVEYLHRRNGRDLERAKHYLDRLIEYEANKDRVDIDPLAEFEDALLGCVYEPNGNPVPCYDESAVIDQLEHGGMSRDEATDYLDRITEGIKVVWVRDLELDGRPKEPCLKIVR